VTVTSDQILEVLRPVEDPELHRSIVELEMVRDITIASGSVTVLVALTIPGCPLRNEITNRVSTAVAALDGVDAVDVQFTVMTDEQRDRVREILRSGGGDHPNAGQQGHGHADGPKRGAPFMMPESKTRIIAMASGKGGVGKSSITVNTAIALAARGKRVALLDADIYGFSVPRMMGITADPVVIDGSDDVPPVLVLPVAFGVSVISAGYFIDEDKAFVWRGPMLHKALEQFLNDVYWGEPDYFLIDMPPGTGDVALSMAQYLPRTEVLIITTPQPAAQRVAQRTAALAEKVNLTVRGIIENMSWFTGDDGKRYELFGSGGGAELAAKLDVPLIGNVPLVPELRQGGDDGTPITISDPKSEAAMAFENIAEWIESNGPTKRYRSELTIVNG